MSAPRICPYCKARLDPQEHCDCPGQKAADEGYVGGADYASGEDVTGKGLMGITPIEIKHKGVIFDEIAEDMRKKSLNVGFINPRDGSTVVYKLKTNEREIIGRENKAERR